MVGNLTNLKLSMLAQSSGKYPSKSGMLVCKKFGPLGSEPVAALAGSMAKMFPTKSALILMSFEVDAELDEVSHNGIVPIGNFSVTGRSMRQSFLVTETK